jgi:hypothetical protein
MDKKEINYYEILRVFEGEDDCPITALIEEIAGSIYDIEGQEHNDKASEMSVEQQVVALALGVTLMTMFKIDKSQIKAWETIRSIQEMISESGIFPLLPIESTEGS